MGYDVCCTNWSRAIEIENLISWLSILKSSSQSRIRHVTSFGAITAISEFHVLALATTQNAYKIRKHVEM